MKLQDFEIKNKLKKAELQTRIVLKSGTDQFSSSFGCLGPNEAHRQVIKSKNNSSVKNL